MKGSADPLNNFYTMKLITGKVYPSKENVLSTGSSCEEKETAQSKCFVRSYSNAVDILLG